MDGDVERNFNMMEDLFLSVHEWIENNIFRDPKRLILQNILTSSAQYLRVAADNLETHISVLALATRSLYELNVWSRSILASAEKLAIWQSEAITDKIQSLEGVLELQTATEMNAQREILKMEIDRIIALRTKYNLPVVKKPASTGVLAAEVGLGNEHSALFKLFSKLVHPSSYLTNDYNNAASHEVRVVLQLHSQLYAWDAFHRICDELSVPAAIRSFDSTEKI